MPTTVFELWTSVVGSNCRSANGAPNQRTLTIGGRITVPLVSSLTGLTRQENMLLFVCTETTESKRVQQLTSYNDLFPYCKRSLPKHCPPLCNKMLIFCYEILKKFCFGANFGVI